MLDFSNAYFTDWNQVDGYNGKYLPHLRQNDKLVFVTFHLGDSLPQSVLKELKLYREEWLNHHKEPYSSEELRTFNQLFSKKMNDYLDANYGACILRERENAQIVVDTLRYYDGISYNLISYVVMPNHLHFVVQLLDVLKYDIGKIVKGIKSYTTKGINLRMKTEGSIWHKDYYDRLIRDPKHLQNTLIYIYKNAKSANTEYLYYHPDLNFYCDAQECASTYSDAQECAAPKMK